MTTIAAALKTLPGPVKSRKAGVREWLADSGITPLMIVIAHVLSSLIGGEQLLVVVFN